MKRILIALLPLLMLLQPAPALAVDAVGAQTVSACGTPNNTPVVGNPYALTMDTAGKLCVNAAVTATVTGSTSNATSGVATSSTNLPTVSYNYGFNGTTWDQLQVDASKNLKTISQTGSTTAVTQPTASLLNATVVGTGTFAVQATPALGTTGGWTPKLLNALSNTAVVVKASGGQLGMLQCYNPNSSQVYIQIYNIAQGSVTVGASTPLQSVPIAPTSTGGFVMDSPGQEYGTAITVAATTTATGGTAPSTAADCNAAYN